MSTTAFPLGIYVGNPNGNDPNAEGAFESQFNAFVKDMGGARPGFMDAFTDYGQDPSQWGANNAWTAWSWAQSGNSYAGPGSGITPVVGVPLASNAGGWGNVDTFYQQVIAGQYDADYKAIVDAWAQSGYKTAQFRIAYEFNGNFMPWAPGNSGSASANADFVQAFQHVANLIHSEGKADGITAQTVWNPTDINYSTDPTQLYPGDQYVDVISTDAYSPLYPNDLTNWAGNAQTQAASGDAWATSATNREHFWQYTNGSQWNPTPGLGSTGWSMQNAIDLAKLHNKPLSLSETGAGPAASTIGPADDPAFPQWLAGALSQARAEGVAIQNVNIWDTDVGDGAWGFSNGEKPQEEAAWGKYFGTGSTTLASTGVATGPAGGTTGSGTGSTGSGSGDTAPITPTTLGTDPVFRFYNPQDGGHFFTTSVAERNQLLGTQTGMQYEGVGFNAVDPAANDPNAAPVYRFYEENDGGHFYTISQTERDAVMQTRPDMHYEGIAFYEDKSPQPGDVPVYRFYEPSSGGHFFTSSTAEMNSILATRPDMKLEGPAFYAPT